MSTILSDLNNIYMSVIHLILSGQQNIIFAL
jgi:hypothetical protein